MKVLGKVISLLLLSGCHKSSPEPEPINPPASAVDAWKMTEDRLVSGFTPGGWVVSTNADGSPANEGDSLIWTGVALASMDCVKGAPLDLALKEMILSTDGYLYRHPSMSDEGSLDGALGFYRGIAHRIQVCHEDSWIPLMVKHKARAPYLSRDTVLEEPFAYVRDRVAGDPINPTRRSVLESAVSDWAFATKISRSACFRVHLGLLALQTLEVLGEGVNRDGFCQVTLGMNLPTVNQFCGRAGLKDFLDNFSYDTWQYRPQRCPEWESPDGDGQGQPAVDRLRGLADFYKFNYNISTNPTAKETP